MAAWRHGCSPRARARRQCRDDAGFPDDLLSSVRERDGPRAVALAVMMSVRTSTPAILAAGLSDQGVYAEFENLKHGGRKRSCSPATEALRIRSLAAYTMGRCFKAGTSPTYRSALRRHPTGLRTKSFLLFTG